MEKNPKQWHEIAELINKDKQRALDDFHRLEFVPSARPRLLAPPAPGRWRIFRPAFAALAASLLLAVGLIAFWQLRGGWSKVPAAPAWDEILSGSFLYSGGERLAAEGAAEAPAAAASPLFTAWAEAGLARATIAAGAVDPLASVERGDPGEVRRRIGRVIHEGAFERWLVHWQEFHDKEA